MYFEFIKEARLPGNSSREYGAAEELYSFCHEAERNCRIDPDKSIIAIRQALEVLVSALLCEYGKTQFTREDSLYSMICECKNVCGNFISSGTIDKLQELRGKANDYVHVQKRVNTSSKYQICGRHATVQIASDATVLLYKTLSTIFGNAAQNIDITDLPIGDYEILQKYRKMQYEAIHGDFKYLAERKGSITSTYAYIRPFSNIEGDKNSVFNERDLAIQDVFKNIPASKYIVNGEEISVNRYNNIRYLKYAARRDTKTLDQIVKTLKVKDILKILSDVSLGLCEIMLDGVNVHHRSIRPTCIFVNKDGNMYSGKLGCFETAKIEISTVNVETVHINMLQANQGSIYVHPMLRKARETTSEEWEKGDVYSLAAILMYCLEPDVVNKGNFDYASITENFSSGFVTTIINILMTESLEIVPSMAEFHRMLEEEMKAEGI